MKDGWAWPFPSCLLRLTLIQARREIIIPSISFRLSKYVTLKFTHEFVTNIIDVRNCLHLVHEKMCGEIGNITSLFVDEYIRAAEIRLWLPMRDSVGTRPYVHHLPHPACVLRGYEWDFGNTRSGTCIVPLPASPRWSCLTLRVIDHNLAGAQIWTYQVWFSLSSSAADSPVQLGTYACYYEY